MRKYYYLAVALMVAAMLLAPSCKANLDKVKIANLLTGFVLDYAAGNPIDEGEVQELAGVLAISFVESYADEIPARYRDETVAFAKAVIPLLVKEFDLGLGKKKAAGAVDIQEPMAAFVLQKFELFHENY